MSGEHHRLVIGSTRTGKTFSRLTEALAWPGRVFYWNPQDDPELPSAFTAVAVQASLHDDLGLMFKSARARINYIPSEKLDVAKKELAAILGWLMKPGRVWSPPVLVLVDEADMVSPQGAVHTPSIHLAARGAKHRVFGEFITQFPAQLSKTIIRNCSENVIFPSPYAAPYYRTYGLPGDRIEELLRAAPPYHYLTWTMPGVLAGPFKTKS